MNGSITQDGDPPRPPRFGRSLGSNPYDDVLYEGPVEQNRKPVVLLARLNDGSRRIFAREYRQDHRGDWWPRPGGVSLTLAQLNRIVGLVRAIVGAE